MTQEAQDWTPWQIDAFDHYCGRDPDTAGEYANVRLLGLSQFETIAEVRHGDDDHPGTVDGNARRFKASWNATSSLSTESLENGVVERAFAEICEFVRRVEVGEVRSKRTYAVFKVLLSEIGGEA